ncbi:ribokinase [Evansella sp. AB-P1]|uniref:ribokinase n=1 Tax=Evansella sp. AB-P1 TaxID=3037653 RepID=UPI00241C167C|nr:ribokinase [Evansella sp. AB-P1]MDG5789280.1 ribokinase [Evansella sp. AB-P1]
MGNGNVLVVGSLNMDLTVRVDKTPQIGETRVGKTFKQLPGGKGANQAIAAARLGSSVSMIGCVGEDDYGEELQTALRKETINIEGITKTRLSSTGIALITVDDRGNNSIVIVSGANEKLDSVHIDKHISLFDQSDVIVFQLEVPTSTIYHSIDICKKMGKKVIVNLAPYHELKSSIYKKIDYLILNKIEAQCFLKLPDSTVDTLEEKLKEIKDQHIILTLGEDGVMYVYNGQSFKYNAYKIRARDTTGAGDAFTGAFASEISRGKGIIEAIEFAIKASAISVSREGAQNSLPFLKDLQKFKGNRRIFIE